jgi:serine protease Do
MLSRFGFVIFGLLAATPTKANEAPEHHAKALWLDAAVVDTDTELDRLNRAFVQLANNVRPAIVQVRVTRIENDKAPNDSSRTQSRGSGFIINPEGYILTAQHVVDKSQEVEVRLADGERIQGRIVATDVHADLAILKISAPKPLPVVPLGDSSNNRVGDLAVVFGYPYGRESSMNVGVIGRPGRSFLDSASYEFIQTDAGAYAGGSGGPLLNSKGHVIGMITMASERGNMGFATPINVIKRLIPRLLRGEKPIWGWLGVQTTELSLEDAKTLGLTAAKGVLVYAVLRGQPAEIGGLQKKDIILSVNDAQVDSPRDVSRMIAGLEAGRIVKLTILRNGKTLQISVPLGSKPEAIKGRES